LALVKSHTADQALGPFVPLARTRQYNVTPFGVRSAVRVWVDVVAVTFTTVLTKVLTV
jgi:hypothetical protein